jgi:integrase
VASIKKRGDGYIVRWRDPDGRQRGRTAPSYRAAQQLCRDIEETVALGRRWEPADARQVPQLGEVMAACLKSWSRTRAARTLLDYGGRLDLFAAFLQDRDRRRRWTLDDLGRELLEDLWAWLRPGRSVSRCNEVVSTVGAFWAWAWESETYGDLTPRPRRPELPRVTRGQTPAATYAEVDAMLAELDAHPVLAGRRLWERDAALVARWTGMRGGAILALEWTDIDWERQAIHVRAETTKGGRGGRSIPLRPDLAAELAGWGRREGRVVRVEGTQSTALTRLDQVVAPAWERAGVRPAVWRRRPMHCLRRALRTHLVTQGVQPDVIDLLLGHRGTGTGGQIYTDAALLWPAMVEAIATVPSVGAAVARLRSAKE